jgi:hypothetical protein
VSLGRTLLAPSTLTSSRLCFRPPTLDGELTAVAVGNALGDVEVAGEATSKIVAGERAARGVAGIHELTSLPVDLVGSARSRAAKTLSMAGAGGGVVLTWCGR